MIKYDLALPIVFIFFIFLLLFIFIIVGRKTFELNEKKRFSFRNYFPHEMYYQNNIKVVTYFRIILILFFALLVVIPIIFASSFRGNNVAFSIVISLFYVFSSLVAFMMFLIKPNYLKQFKIYSTLSLCFNILSNGTFGFLQISKLYEHVAFKIIGGFAFALALFNVILASNPKLSKWDKLDEKINDDGTITYERPKISPLAFTSWLSDASLILGEILLLISLLINSLNL